MGVETGNRWCGDEGAYTEVRNRIAVPHVARIRAHIRRLSQRLQKNAVAMISNGMFTINVYTNSISATSAASPRLKPILSTRV